jgi:hypothetical protein
MHIDRVGADKVRLCKLFRAVATACHTLIPSSPHLRPAFDQQDLSFITPTHSFVLLSCRRIFKPSRRHPYHPENHRASIPRTTLSITLSAQIGTIYYVQTRCACLRFTAPITNLTCVIHLPRPSHPPIAPASGLYSYTRTAWYDTFVLIRLRHLITVYNQTFPFLSPTKSRFYLRSS